MGNFLGLCCGVGVAMKAVWDNQLYVVVEVLEGDTVKLEPCFSVSASSPKTFRTDSLYAYASLSDPTLIIDPTDDEVEELSGR